MEKNMMLYGLLAVLGVSIFTLVILLWKSLQRNKDKFYQMEEADLTAEQKKLSKSGQMYRFGNYNLHPMTITMLTVAICTIFSMFLFLLTGNTILAACGFVGLHLAYNGYVAIANKIDNRKILSDIYHTIAILKVELQAGAFPMDALADAYEIAYNKRYKEALGELLTNVNGGVPMANAITIFQNRFDSGEINILCSHLKNFIQYGITSSYLSDLTGELETISEEMNIQLTDEIKQKSSICYVCLFVILVSVTLYTLQFYGSDMLMKLLFGL